MPRVKFAVVAFPAVIEEVRPASFEAPNIPLMVKFPAPGSAARAILLVLVGLSPFAQLG